MFNYVTHSSQMVTTSDICSPIKCVLMTSLALSSHPLWAHTQTHACTRLRAAQTDLKRFSLSLSTPCFSPSLSSTWTRWNTHRLLCLCIFLQLISSFVVLHRIRCRTNCRGQWVWRREAPMPVKASDRIFRKVWCLKRIWWDHSGTNYSW